MWEGEGVGMIIFLCQLHIVQVYGTNVGFYTENAQLRKLRALGYKSQHNHPSKTLGSFVW